VNKMAKTENVTIPSTVPERQIALRRKRSRAHKIYNAHVANGGKLEPGAGKGLEPLPWCECHNRNPCPIDKELGVN